MSADILTLLGQNIQNRRVARGGSLEDFAEACSMTPTHLGTIEAGRHDVPTTVLIAIARGLECKPGDLLEDPSNPSAVSEIESIFERIEPKTQDALLRLLRVVATTSGKKQKPAGKSDDAETITLPKPGNGLPS
jgi:transcriptional regulator with XRE-family HTH domain